MSLNKRAAAAVALARAREAHKAAKISASARTQALELIAACTNTGGCLLLTRGLACQWERGGRGEEWEDEGEDEGEDGDTAATKRAAPSTASRRSRRLRR